jgi:prepilin-type N-terminal cleavage/methylation domain-containing protein
MWSQAKSRVQAQESGFTLIELMVVVAIIGILAGIAIPNFMKFQTRSRQSEAKVNLKAIFLAKKAYHATYETYGCAMCDWVPEPGNRYSYLAALEPALGFTGGFAQSDIASDGAEMNFVPGERGCTMDIILNMGQGQAWKVARDWHPYSAGSFPSGSVVSACSDLDDDTYVDFWTMWINVPLEGQIAAPTPIVNTTEAAVNIFNDVDDAQQYTPASFKLGEAGKVGDPYDPVFEPFGQGAQL